MSLEEDPSLFHRENTTTPSPHKLHDVAQMDNSYDLKEKDDKMREPGLGFYLVMIPFLGYCGIRDKIKNFRSRYFS